MDMGMKKISSEKNPQIKSRNPDDSDIDIIV